MPSVEPLPESPRADAEHPPPPRVPSASNAAKRAMARNASVTSSASSAATSTTASEPNPKPTSPQLEAAAAAARDYNPPGGPAVFLNVYDITTPDDPALIPRINSTLYYLGVGLFHSGIEVYGVEYAYGGHYDDLSGIFGSPPRRAEGVVYRRSIPLGETALSEDAVERIISDLGSTVFQGNKYSLIGNNCNHFAASFAKFLGTPKSVPAWVNRMAGFATQVSCLLPDAVEQPLSELAPTAGNSLDRRSMSLAAPPPRKSQSRSRPSGHTRSHSASAVGEVLRNVQIPSVNSLRGSTDRGQKSTPPVSSVASNSSTVSSPSGADERSPPGTPPEALSGMDSIAVAYRGVPTVAPPPPAAKSVRKGNGARSSKGAPLPASRDERMSVSPWLSSSALEEYD